MLEEKVGPVSCTVAVRGAVPAAPLQLCRGCRRQLTQPVQVRRWPRRSGSIRRELGFDAHRPSAFSAGVAYTLCARRSREASLRRELQATSSRS